jgi:DUF1016 N-terminal domain
MARKSLPPIRIPTRPVEVPPTVFQRVQSILEQARAQVARSINTEMVRAYWLIGREIIEEEQRGRSRAGYGDELIAQLSVRLQAEFRRGFTVKFDGIWHDFFKAIWHHSPINGLSVGGLVDSPLLCCRESIHGDDAASAQRPLGG